MTKRWLTLLRWIGSRMLDDILCCCCCSCKLLRSFSRVWSILGRVVIAISDSSSAMSAWRSSLGGMDMREEKSKGVLVKGHCWVTIMWQCHAERKWVGDKYMCVLLFFWAEQMCLGDKWKKQKSLSWSKNVGCSQFRVTSILGFHPSYVSFIEMLLPLNNTFTHPFLDSWLQPKFPSQICWQ